MFMVGCAGWRLPRIDPSGRQLFLPGETTAVTPFDGSTFAPPAPIVGGIVSVPGNLQAPPVYSDSITGPFAPTVASPPVASTVPSGAVLPGQDYLRITPQRVLAPVGTEVVLRAGLCSGSGYLLANQRVEWLLARDGAGQFVDLGNQGEMDFFRWPWFTPRKIDNWYAVGTTSPYPRCVRRGNADPSDDVQILRGEAWVTVTSPTEGTSHVTAFTPVIEDWNRRRATTTIYWVDAQWIFSPSATVTSGSPHPLTTTITRRTDGTPIAGWIVRYEVEGSGAALGYEGGNMVEVPTDAQGRASIEVSPTDSGSGSTNIRMTLVRPAQSGPGSSPPLEIGSSLATITWGGGSVVDVVPPGHSPAANPPGTFQPPAPRQEPQPFTPSPSEPYTPPQDEPSPGRADLDVRIQRDGPEQVDVGGFARFEVFVTNRGDGTARNIVITDAFDTGLRHPRAKPGEFAIDYRQMRDLPPGESASVVLSFDVLDAGRQCHEVTVTAEGGIRAVDRACILARSVAPPVQPQVEVTMIAPARHIVGEMADFKIVVKNVGDVPVENLEIVDKHDSALNPTDATAGHEPLSEGGIAWNIDRLDVGERRVFEVRFQCMTPSDSACNRATIRADGGVLLAREKCIEILPSQQPLQPQPPGTFRGGADVVPEGLPAGLKLSIVVTSNPAKVGERTVVYVTVENGGQKTETNVAMRLLFPPEFTPDQAQIQSPVDYKLVGREIQFRPMAEFRPGEKQKFVIPVSVNRDGKVRIWGQLKADQLGQPLDKQSNEIEILPRSL